jgi:hypothetical protein
MNDINNDTNLREAVSRREQHLPPMPADLNERLMRRLQERHSTLKAPQSKNHCIRLYVAASILLIICIGTVLFTNKPTDYSLYTSHQMETQQKPVGLKRFQAGVRPLQKQMVTLAPKGRQNVLPPPRGLATPRLSTGASPLPVVSTPLRGYHELPDTLGDGIWQSERNVVRAMQMLGECEAVIEKSEQEMRNTIVRATFNATPKPANAVLVTNEAGDCEVIETKNIIEI